MSAADLLLTPMQGAEHCEIDGVQLDMTVAPEKGAKMAGKKGPAVQLRYELFKRRAGSTSVR